MSKGLVPLSVALLAALAAFALTGCQEVASSLTQGVAPSKTLTQSKSSAPSQTATASTSTSEPAEPANLVIADEVVGKGHAAKPGDKVSVDYTGTLADGTEFGSSLGKKPLTFTIGSDDVIRGLSRGVIGMMVGGKRKLTIQPELGYGEEGNPKKDVPPNAVLIYEVELLKIK